MKTQRLFNKPIRRGLFFGIVISISCAMSSSAQTELPDDGKKDMPCFDQNAAPIQVMGEWHYDINKIYACPQINVGLGTIEPQGKLDVRGTTKTKGLSINTFDEAAIMTLRGGTPGSQNQFKTLEIQSKIGEPIFQVFNSGEVVLKNPSPNNPNVKGELTFGFQNNSDRITSIPGRGLSFSVWSDGQVFVPDHLLRLQPAGGVGINVPLDHDVWHALEVGGTIRAEKVIVEVGWADFVFEDDYRLPPLSEVSEFIEENGHLPEIPSEQEILDKGLDLGDLVRLQMQKIEELTLYVIDLESKLNRQNSKQ